MPGLAEASVTSTAEIFLDSNATTQPSPGVVATVVTAMAAGPLNSASVHGRGVQARDLGIAARDAITLLVGGCYPEGVCFTSGATEANNIVLGPIHCDEETTLLVSSVEHASVLRPAEQARRRGCDVRILPVDGNGLVDPDAVRVEAGTARERLVVSIQWANSETGIVQALAEIAREVRLARETFFHSDAVQALGRVPVNLTAVDVDAISVTAHKMHGPQGIGALIMRDRDEKVPPPLMFGGDHQAGLRPGTEPVQLAAGFGSAASERAGRLDIHASRLLFLRNLFESAVKEMMPDTEINGSGVARVPNTSNIRFRGVDGGALVAQLDDAGIRCSQGSACSSGRPQPSHVLLAMGLPDRHANESVRFSFSIMNTEEEALRAAEVVATTAKSMQGRMSW